MSSTPSPLSFGATIVASGCQDKRAQQDGNSSFHAERYLPIAMAQVLHTVIDAISFLAIDCGHVTFQADRNRGRHSYYHETETTQKASWMQIIGGEEYGHSM